MKMSQMRKRPKLTKQILERYIEFYLNNPPSELDHYELMYFESQYSGIMKNLTRDFTEEQFVNFYQNPFKIINVTYGIFGLTRKLNYILFQFNTARISFLQERGLNPKFPVIDCFDNKNHLENFGSFKVIKKK
jgi:hypothetical protein